MIFIDDFVHTFSHHFPVQKNQQPWKVTAGLNGIICDLIQNLGPDYTIKGNMAIHTTALIEEGAVLKAPLIIGPDCFVGAHAYLRNGVFLGNSARVGTGCEIKSSIVLDRSAIAHFNFIGDSIIGSQVNFEAGSITANHFNERNEKNIFVVYQGNIIDTGCIKFGALVGDGTRIGANAVLSPGTVLQPLSIVKRLELIDQGA